LIRDASLHHLRNTPEHFRRSHSPSSCLRSLRRLPALGMLRTRRLGRPGRCSHLTLCIY
jgi:hypothetical protein